MQNFELVIWWKNRRFIDALFIDLYNAFLKEIGRGGPIFTVAVTKGLNCKSCLQSKHLPRFNNSINS